MDKLERERLNRFLEWHDSNACLIPQAFNLIADDLDQAAEKTAAMALMQEDMHMPTTTVDMLREQAQVWRRRADEFTRLWENIGDVTL